MRRAVRLELGSGDLVAGAASAFLFSVALGLASVVLPLLAIHEGYSAVEIGLLTAVSGMSQLSSRLVLGPMLRRFPDWTLILAAALVMALSNTVLVTSAAVGSFVLAQALQGIARGCFWTGSQTHVVQGAKTAVGGLASINLIAGLGLLVGPILGGTLATWSLGVALAVGAAVAAAACVPTLFMEHFPPFALPADRPSGAIWRRSGVSSGCWAGVTAGAWRGLLGSYVPVLLSEAGQSSTVIGSLMAMTNAAALFGAGLVGRLRKDAFASAFVIGTLVTGVTTALTAPFAEFVFWTATFLTLSGLGVGALQTLGPAIASDSVTLEERGDAIAAAGTFRAAALLLSPLAVAGLVVAMPLAGAMALAGASMAIPAVTGPRLRRHLASRTHK